MKSIDALLFNFKELEGAGYRCSVIPVFPFIKNGYESFICWWLSS
jgi:hypothetical protein